MMLFLRYSFSSSAIPLSFSFPFEYTLSPQQFSFQDIRFKQLPFSRQFAQHERQHIHHVLQKFQNIINSSKISKFQQEYIHTRLLSKTQELQSILRETGVNLKFNINTNLVSKSKGYLEIKPQGDISLHQKDIKDIHLYRFERERQILSVSLKPERQVLTAQDQLKKDLTDQMGEKSKAVRQQLENMHKSKVNKLADRFMDKLMSLGKKKANKKFEPYFIIQQVKGEMDCCMTYDNKEYLANQIAFDSKWLYWVNNLQSDDLKKHRKRTLFDFQFWNRGNFFPIRNYAAEVAHFE